MKEHIAKRALALGRFMLQGGSTVRSCAAKFGISKTTVHKDLRTRLPALDEELACRVGQVMEENLRERHLRGGRATREKYRRAGEAKSIPP